MSTTPLVHIKKDQLNNFLEYLKKRKTKFMIIEKGQQKNLLMFFFGKCSSRSGWIISLSAQQYIRFEEAILIERYSCFFSIFSDVLFIVRDTCSFGNISLTTTITTISSPSTNHIPLYYYRPPKCLNHLRYQQLQLHHHQEIF